MTIGAGSVAFSRSIWRTAGAGGMRQRSTHDKRLDSAVNACQVFADHHLADVLTALAPSSLQPIPDCQTSATASL
jgi:hypothetical protein